MHFLSKKKLFIIICLQSDCPLGCLEKDWKKITSQQSPAAPRWRLDTITCTFSSAPVSMRSGGARRRQQQSTSICQHFEGLGGQDAGSSFFFFFPSLFSLPFSLLIEADLYQAPVALTPVAITRCAPLHRSGAWTAEWQLDNPLWNDLGPGSARPHSRWKLWRSKESRFPGVGRHLRPVNNLPVACSGNSLPF